MRIVVLGGGIIGITTAYELTKDGHEVTVLEANDELALGASFANAGMVAPGHAFAWASPKAPRILLKSLWRDDQALRFKFSSDPAFWIWSWKFLMQCTSEKAIRNTKRKHRIATYSQKVLEEITAETQLDYDAGRTGLLYFHRSEQTLERGIANMKLLRDLGQKQQILDREGIARLDPALEPVKDQLAGAIYCPTDSIGDARKFTLGLAGVFTRNGGKIRYGVKVKCLETEGDKVTAAITNQGRITADAFVLSLGIYSPHVGHSVGLRLPIYPIKGYSLTFPRGGANLAPRVGGVDEDNLIAYSPMGDRLRVTAVAEFAGYDASHKPSDFRVMVDKLRALLPSGADYSKPQYWAGLRPMTPDSMPIIGRTGHRNLIVNTGHGHIGWTMSCGSARIVRDLFAGRTPEIPLDGLEVR